MSILTDAWAGFKAAVQKDPATTRPPFAGGNPAAWRWDKGDAWDWEKAAGEPDANSILTIALRWIQTNLVAAPLGIKRGEGDSSAWQPTHPLVPLLRVPNPVYDGRTLLQSAVLDYTFRGTAYFLKSFNANRTALLQLWYEPYATIRPVWNPHPTVNDPWIAWYEVWRDGAWLRLPFTSDVIAWTDGAPQAATRRGRDPLAALRKERALANAVDDYLATTLRNFGVAGMIAAPMPGTRINDGQGLKDRLTMTTTGSQRGGVVVLSDPVNLTFPGAAPNTMGVEALDGRIEERLTAAMGLNRLVLNLGKDGTFANQEGAEHQAWVDCILPLQADLCACLSQHLLPHFTSRTDEVLAFNTDGIKALADNRTDTARAHSMYVAAGVLTPNEVRAELGKPAHPDGDKLGKPQAAPVAAPLAGTAPMMPAVPATNGNGTHT